MPFNVDSPPSDAALAFRDFINLTRQLKQRCQTWSTLLMADVDGAVIVGIRSTLKAYRPRIAAAANTTGIQAVARTWFGDAAYDFNSNRAPANAAMIAVFNATTALRAPVGWSASEDTLTVAETAALKTAIDGLIAAL